MGSMVSLAIQATGSKDLTIDRGLRTSINPIGDMYIGITSLLKRHINLTLPIFIQSVGFIRTFQQFASPSLIPTDKPLEEGIGVDGMRSQGSVRRVS